MIFTATKSGATLLNHCNAQSLDEHLIMCWKRLRKKMNIKSGSSQISKYSVFPAASHHPIQLTLIGCYLHDSFRSKKIIDKENQRKLAYRIVGRLVWDENGAIEQCLSCHLNCLVVKTKPFKTILLTDILVPLNNLT